MSIVSVGPGISEATWGGADLAFPRATNTGMSEWPSGTGSSQNTVSPLRGCRRGAKLFSARKMRDGETWGAAYAGLSKPHALLDAVRFSQYV